MMLREASHTYITVRDSFEDYGRVSSQRITDMRECPGRYGAIQIFRGHRLLFPHRNVDVRAFLASGATRGNAIFERMGTTVVLCR